MKAYITKYALSVGIKECEIEPSKYVDGIYRGKDDRTFFPNDFRQTRSEAVQRAEEMRTKRIAGLKKQIAKLEKLRFDVEG